jgi:pimeloyl-ACP methyl ester carboxylesterase/DNA-binding CsgD family transcriptional regulator
MSIPELLTSQDRVAALKAALNDLADPQSGEGAYVAAVHAVGAAFEAEPEASEAVVAAHPLAASPESSTLAAFGLVAAIAGGGQILFAEDALSGAGAAVTALAASLQRRRRCFGTLRLGQGLQAAAVAAPAAEARSWPLPAAARTVLEAGPGRVAILAFVPTSSPEFAPAVARAFGLTPAEARLATALFTCDTLAGAASLLGTSAETLRKQMTSVLRKSGSPRRSALMAEIIEIVAGDYSRPKDRSALMREAFGLTAAEARVADGIAHGRTIREIAAQYDVSPHTVRAQADAALAKTGQTGAANLARLLTEISALAVWTQAGDTRRLHQNTLLAATRIVPAPGGRRIAAADYGPAGGPAILCFHQGMAYRWVKANLRTALQARGFRVVSFDLPDCGQTDAAAGRPMFEAAADDAERVLAALKIGRVRIYAPLGASGPALTFAARRPDLVEEGLLLMPRPPRHELLVAGPLQRVVLGALQRPGLARGFFETMRASASSRLLHWAYMQAATQLAIDRAATADPAFMAERHSEVLAAHARSIGGMLALEQGYRSWTVPTPGGRRWTVVETAAQMFRGAEARPRSWDHLPGVRFVRLEDAGRTAAHTHADAIADLFTAPCA